MSTPIEKKPTAPAGTPEHGEPLRQIVAAASEPASSHLGARLRSYFLTGLIVVGPVAITIYVVWWFITLVDAWVKPLIPPQYLPEHYLPFNVPGVGLIFGITGVMLVGISFTWYSIIAATFSNARVRALYARFELPLNILIGLMWIGLGIKLLTTPGA